jgi:hypothetical protein
MSINNNIGSFIYKIINKDLDQSLIFNYPDFKELYQFISNGIHLKYFESLGWGRYDEIIIITDSGNKVKIKEHIDSFNCLHYSFY